MSSMIGWASGMSSGGCSTGPSDAPIFSVGMSGLLRRTFSSSLLPIGPRAAMGRPPGSPRPRTGRRPLLFGPTAGVPVPRLRAFEEGALTCLCRVALGRGLLLVARGACRPQVVQPVVVASADVVHFAGATDAAVRVADAAAVCVPLENPQASGMPVGRKPRQAVAALPGHEPSS